MTVITGFSSTGTRKKLIEFKLLFFEQILQCRSILPWYLFLQTVIPVAFVFAFGHFGSVTPTATSLMHIISGSITFTLFHIGLTVMANTLARMHQDGTFLYYCALPVSKVSFIAALLASKLILLLPSLVVPLVAGSLMYGLELQLDGWLLLVIVLGIFTLSSLGALLGRIVQSFELVSALCSALTFMMMLASPTFLPAGVLPLPLQIVGYLLPTTYISDAIRHCLLGVYDLSFYLDVLALSLVSSLALLAIQRFWVWRID